MMTSLFKPTALRTALAPASFNALAFLMVVLLIAATGCSREARSKRHIARAEKALAAERFHQAELEYLMALKEKPKDPVALTGVGLVCFDQGKAQQAFTYLKKAVELDPGRDTARLRLGILCRAMGQTAEARQHALKVLGGDPASEEALLLLIDCSSTEAELQECAGKLEVLSATAPEKPATSLAQGGLQLRNKDWDGAEASFKKAAALAPKWDRPHSALFALNMARNRPAEAEQALETAAKLAPIRSPARIHLATFKRQQGKTDEAVALATEITREAPDYLPAWIFLAETALLNNSFDRCASSLKKAFDLDPTSYEALDMQVRLLVEKRDAPGAVSYCERILRLYGTNSQHLYRLALAQALNRQEALALATANMAVAASTNNVEAIILQNTLLQREGRYSSAATSLTNLIGRASTLPKESLVALPQAFALLAQSYLGMKNSEKAAETFDSMRLSFPGLPEVQLEAAEGLASLGKKQEATAGYLRFAAMTTNAARHVVAARGLARIGETNGARNGLEAVLQSTPGYLPAIETLTELDLREGNFDAARSRLQARLDKAETPELLLLLANVYVEEAGFTGQKNDKTGPAPGAAQDSAKQQKLKAAESVLTRAIELKPDFASAYNLLARVWVDSNRQAEALEKLKSLTEKTNSATTWIQIAAIQSHAADYASAAQSYEKALSIAPNSVEIMNNLATLYSSRLSRLNRAHELAQQAYKAMPLPAVSDTLGYILLQKGDYDRALDLLEKAARALPDQPEVQCHLGIAYYMTGRAQMAKQALDKAAFSPMDYSTKVEATNLLAILNFDASTADPNTLKQLQDRVSFKPNDIIALEKLAAIMERDGTFAAAAERYSQILKFSPTNVRAMFNLARLYADHLSDTDKALELGKAARNNAPDDPQIAHLLGRISLQKGNWTWANTLLDQAVRALPDDPFVTFDSAWSAYYMGHIPEAETRMKRASARPEFARTDEARLFLALLSAAEQAAEDPSALATARSILQTNATYLPALALSAAEDERNAKYSKAAETYDRILARWPLFSPAVRALAILSFERLNNDQRAYELALKAREAYPNDARLARLLGFVAAKKGDNLRAAQTLAEAAKTITDDAELFYHLGAAQYAIKARTDCRQSLEHALRLNLPEPLAAKAKEMLAEEN